MPARRAGWTVADRRQRVLGYNYQQRQFADFAALDRRTGSCSPAPQQRTRPPDPERDAVARAVTIGGWSTPATAAWNGSTRSRRTANASRSAARRSSFRPAKAISSVRYVNVSIRTICSWVSAPRIASSGRTLAYVFGAALVGDGDAGADRVHAPRIGARQSPGPADPSRPGFHAHQRGRAARRRRNRPDAVRGVRVPRRGARSGRQPLQHRTAGARFVGRCA